jgi:hypothetical protein
MEPTLRLELSGLRTRPRAPAEAAENGRQHQHETALSDPERAPFVPRREQRERGHCREASRHRQLRVRGSRGGAPVTRSLLPRGPERDAGVGRRDRRGSRRRTRRRLGRRHAAGRSPRGHSFLRTQGPARGIAGGERFVALEVHPRALRAHAFTGHVNTIVLRDRQRNSAPPRNQSCAPLIHTFPPTDKGNKRVTSSNKFSRKSRKNKLNSPTRRALFLTQAPTRGTMSHDQNNPPLR